MVNDIFNKILIIDDDEDLAFIISEMLESYGYKVTCAESGEMAFELLESNTYHIILLDINLPDATGFEICEELRRTSTTPVIFAKIIKYNLEFEQTFWYYMVIERTKVRKSVTDFICEGDKGG